MNIYNPAGLELLMLKGGDNSMLDILNGVFKLDLSNDFSAGELQLILRQMRH